MNEFRGQVIIHMTSNSARVYSFVQITITILGTRNYDNMLEFIII